MLKATVRERQHVVDYMAGETPDEALTLAQKVHSEQLHGVRHDIWDVHTVRDRWWVITNPTNMYRQDQFPNMDLALTFHVGLCLRMPRSERRDLADLRVEPLADCWRALEQASEALQHAEEVEDYQAIGMRCREALVSFVHAAQEVVPLPEAVERPKGSDFVAWSGHIVAGTLGGASQKERRALITSSTKATWAFCNWLTHTRSAHLHDAEAAVASTELLLSLLTTALIRHVRGVPERCPSCRSERLSPERGTNSRRPGKEYERPVCDKCGWVGTPVEVRASPPSPRRPPPAGACATMEVPLRGAAPPLPSGKRQRSRRRTKVRAKPDR